MPTADAETKTVGGVSAAAIARAMRSVTRMRLERNRSRLGGAPAPRGNPLAREVEDDVDLAERPVGEPRDVEAPLGEVEVGVAILRPGADDPVDGMAVGLEALDKRPGDQAVRSAHQDADRIKSPQFPNERALAPLSVVPELTTAADILSS